MIDARPERNAAWHRAATAGFHGRDHRGADGPMRRAGWDLARLAERHRRHRARGAGPFTPFLPHMPLDGESVLVEVAFEDDGAAGATEAALARLGMTTIRRGGRLVSGLLPIEALEDTAALPALRFLRPSYRRTAVGLVTSQGDTASAANLARAIPPGFDGSGITVGTLSDSYDTAFKPTTDAGDDVTNGDLPAGIVVLDDYGHGNVHGSDEGRAMMQIIADLAPGAAQKFHTAFDGQAAFAQGILDLAAAGCDVIVDDIFYFAEPFFQDGVIAQAVDTVTAQGVAYFSAAGNSARDSYDAGFHQSTSGITGLKGGLLHDFDPGAGDDPLQQITVPVGETLTVILQWDQPFFSVSGAPGCANDVDLLLLGSGDGQLSVLALATDNNVGGDAVEILQFTNNGSIDIDGIAGADTVFNLSVEIGALPNPGRLKYVHFDQQGSSSVDEYTTNSGTCVGHSNATGTIAVGASAWFNTPAFGLSPAALNYFSSSGGVPILFDVSGSTLAAPEDRSKPDFVAPDGGNNTFFGADSGADPDSSPNFFGTSAAAPHAAAIAALLLQRVGGPGSLSPAEVRSALSSTALNMGAPGFDNDSGTGLVDAEAAMRAVPMDYPFWATLTFNPSTPTADQLPDADPDLDGLTNLAEYFLATDPENKNAYTVDVSENLSGELVAEFGRAKIAPAGLGMLQWSTDMRSWTYFTGPLETVGQSGETVTLRAILGDLTAARTFVRLAIGEGVGP